MKRSFLSDRKRLQQLAFKHDARCGPLVRRFQENESRIDAHSHTIQIWQVYEWLLTPLSLWPVDFEGLAKYVLPFIEADTKFDEELLLLLELTGCAPDMDTQNTVGAFEHLVEAGNYDHLLRQPEKFTEIEASIKRDEELKAAWAEIKKRWDIKSFQNQRGVIRRRMSQERNFRSKWDVDWSDAKSKFRLFFDALCYRWKLYGMENDEPLLLKISANPTPHGTMIFIPRHWSLDLARDLHWNKIGKLHRAFKVPRQGPKLSVSRMEKVEDAKKVKLYWGEARANKLRGDDRYDYVLKKMKKVSQMDHDWVKKHLRLANRKSSSNKRLLTQ